jgi:tonB-dependent siderophore receptor
MGYILSPAGVRAAGYTTFALVAAYRITPRLQVQLNVDKLFDRNDYTRVGGVNTFSIPGAESSTTANLRDDFK